MDESDNITTALGGRQRVQALTCGDTQTIGSRSTGLKGNSDLRRARRRCRARRAASDLDTRSGLGLRNAMMGYLTVGNSPTRSRARVDTPEGGRVVVDARIASTQP